MNGMDWTRAIDAYCERTDASYWSEPVNALTNAAFLVAALIMWRRSEGRTGGRVLSAILFSIGIGSFLFHTHATAWAGTADSTPILVFTLVYVFLANRTFLGWPVWAAALGAAGYVPYTAGLTPVFAALPFFSISSPMRCSCRAAIRKPRATLPPARRSCACRWSRGRWTGCCARSGRWGRISCGIA